MIDMTVAGLVQRKNRGEYCTYWLQQQDIPSRWNWFFCKS